MSAKLGPKINVFLRIAAILAGALLPWVASAAPPVSPPARGLCGPAIAAAERATGLPPGLLAAVAVIESGRPDTDPRALPPGAAHLPPRPVVRLPPPLFRPVALRLGAAAPGTRPPAPLPPMHAWPWTIDADGQGAFFATEAEAIAAVRTLQAAGIHSIDVGCLQVNLQDHPHAFPTLQAAFDPASNALYAARFLARLFDRLHTWPAAVAAYHSQTPGLSEDYRRRVLARWQSGATAPARPAAAYADFEASAAKYADFARR